MRLFEFSRIWAARLAEQNQLGEDRQAEMAYAIQILTITLIDALLTLAFGALLGVLYGTGFCLFTVAAFRHNAGGGHSESPYRCALVTMIVFPLLALLAHYLISRPFEYIQILSALSIAIGFLSIFKYAPASNSKSLPISDHRRKKLKIYGVVVMTCLSLFILALNRSEWSMAVEMGLCVSLSILWVSFNLTETGHRLWLLIDSINLKNIRRCAR